MKKITLLTWVALFAFVSGARAGERFYLLVFGAQRHLVCSASQSHSWGTFVRVVDNGPYHGPAQIESVTVSWLPRTLELQCLDFPKKGINLSLHDTLRWTRDNGLRVSLWGPYEIDKSLYVEAVNKATQLAGGSVLYQLLDFGHALDKVSNCARALGDIPMGAPRPRLGLMYGDEASHVLALNFRPWMLDAEQTHDWVIGALGLNRLGLVRRYVDDCP